jgi:hypothetical protein
VAFATAPNQVLTDTHFGGVKYPSIRSTRAVHWTHPPDDARVNINAYGLLESEKGSTSSRCLWSPNVHVSSRLFTGIFFLRGGFPTTLKSGHRDIPYFHERNKPPQPQSLSAPSESQFRGIGSSMAHRFFTVLTTHATNPVAMSTTCTEIPNA